MPRLTSFAVAAALSLAVTSAQAAQSDNVKITHVTLPIKRDVADSNEIPAAQFTIPFSGKTKARKAKTDMLKMLQPAVGTTSVLAGSDFDEEYLVNATIGGQKFALILDTGSSDTWLAEKSFTCIDLDSEQQPESECAFGPLYNPSTSKTYTELPDLNFNITYGDGEFLLGTVANETVTIGGLTVPKQIIGVVNRAAWFGDGVNSGLVGLCYPLLTSVYKGDESQAAEDDFLVNNVEYNPLFFTAVSDGIVTNPYFSVALDRGTFDQELNDPYDPNLGFISFGGIAPVSTTSVSTTVPVQGYNFETFTPSNASSAVHFFYTVDVQAFEFPGSNKIATFNNDSILDTGTTLLYVPTPVANGFAASVKPPATFSDDEGAYVVACNATVPELGVTINGATFTVDPRDNILPIGTDSEGNDVCILGTTDGGPNENGNIFILGDTFLHNVVVTFNIHTNEITITQRTPY